ncbi:MAG TPA: TIGR03016 family PEP-CTERM system-associated outer membrane protein [Stellaceae bacterium]
MAALPLLLVLTLLAAPARAQTNPPSAPAFPDLQQLQQDLRQNGLNPALTPNSPNPSGAQSPSAAPAKHPPVDTSPAWVITPQIQVSETVTDNANFSHDDRQADLETFLNPSLLVTGDTPRAKVDLSYSPTLLRNVVVTDNNRIDQNLFGTGTVTLVPDALFLNTRASASEGSRSGSFGPIASTDLRNDDRTQVLAYDAGPEWRFPLLDDATGDVRYSIGQTRFFNNTSAVVDANGLPVTTNQISDGTLQDLRLFLDSGDRSRLIAAQLTAEGTRNSISDGGGTDDTGMIMIESQLRLSPELQLLGSLGYEDLRYSNFSFADVNDATWYGGFRWQNAKDAYIQLTYGHRQGSDSLAGDAKYPLTPLTSLFGQYSETVTTPQQQILGNLNTGQLNANNAVVNQSNGLPQSLLVNELTLQNAIYRDRDFRIGASTVNEPDLYQIDVRYEEYLPVAGLATSDSYIGLEALWRHAMNETTSFTLNGGYYIRQQSDENTATIQASISRNMTPTLIGSVGYQFIYGDSNVSSRQFYANSITAYLRKIF